MAPRRSPHYGALSTGAACRCGYARTGTGRRRHLLVQLDGYFGTMRLSTLGSQVTGTTTLTFSLDECCLLRRSVTKLQRTTGLRVCRHRPEKVLTCFYDLSTQTSGSESPSPVDHVLSNSKSGACWSTFQYGATDHHNRRAREASPPKHRHQKRGVHGVQCV